MTKARLDQGAALYSLIEQASRLKDLITPRYTEPAIIPLLNEEQGQTLDTEAGQEIDTEESATARTIIAPDPSVICEVANYLLNVDLATNSTALLDYLSSRLNDKLTDLTNQFNTLPCS